MIRSSHAATLSIPPGHVGPMVLPGTGRPIYWTGRIAIGLRHEQPARTQEVPHSTLWVQRLMLKR